MFFLQFFCAYFLHRVSALKSYRTIISRVFYFTEWIQNVYFVNWLNNWNGFCLKIRKKIRFTSKEFGFHVKSQCYSREEKNEVERKSHAMEKMYSRMKMNFVENLNLKEKYQNIHFYDFMMFNIFYFLLKAFTTTQLQHKYRANWNVKKKKLFHNKICQQRSTNIYHLKFLAFT